MFLGKKVEKWVHAHPNNKAVHQLTQYGIFQCSKEMKSKTKRAFIAVPHTSHGASVQAKFGLGKNEPYN